MMKEQLEKMRADNPKITEQFADLKRDLAKVGGAVQQEQGMSVLECAIVNGQHRIHQRIAAGDTCQCLMSARYNEPL